MTKTIQVRVDENLKESADQLFSSLGLDTSTAIRMFLVASMDAGGIPFAIRKETWEEREQRLMAAFAYREAGGVYLTAEESLTNMRAAMERGRIARSSMVQSDSDANPSSSQPLDYQTLTQEQFDVEIEKGFSSLKASKTVSAKQVRENMQRQHGI